MATYFEWEKGFDPKLLLSKLAHCRTINNGRCSFDAAEHAFWTPVINSSIKADKIVGSLKSLAISQTISDPAETFNDPATFLARCDTRFEILKNAKKTKYVAVFHITYVGPKLFDSIDDGSCRIYWQRNATNKFYSKALTARKKLADLLDAKNVSAETNKLTALLAHVEAINPEHAHDQAADAVDRIRGLLNLIVNSNRGLNPFARLMKPHAINKFRLGPYRTIHNTDGSLAAEMFWYEPRWSHETETAKFKDDPKTVKKSISKWWKKTRKNPLWDHIADGLTRYCRALDQHDTDATLLDLWGALEFMTGTQNERYDVTVDRIIRLFKDSIEARQIATHLKLRRNSSVHAARSIRHEEIDTILIQAETLVSQILFFCINHGMNFKNQRELVRFLDVSLDQAALKRNNEIVRFFIKFHNR